MPLFEVLRKCHLVTLSKICLWLCPCAYLHGYKWINRIFSKLARAISKILFILGSYNFLAYLECIRSYAWSKDHSEPDLGSVGEVSMDSNSLDKTLKSILSTLPRTLVPLKAIMLFHKNKIVAILR